MSIPTQAQLVFQLAHAQARDAVHLGLDTGEIQRALAELGCGCVVLHSAAPDRLTYLQRPDLGRRLSQASRDSLLAAPAQGDERSGRPYDVAVVVADGLSALAIGTHVQPFLDLLVPQMAAKGWRIAPIALVAQGRVAVADEVGELLGAKMVVILIGERPGLSSPDSMGLYLTWMPKVGLTDAYRNCISNVRPAGLPYAEAVGKLLWLMSEAMTRQVTGVELKDETQQADTLAGAKAGNFLLP